MLLTCPTCCLLETWAEGRPRSAVLSVPGRTQEHALQPAPPLGAAHVGSRSGTPALKGSHVLFLVHDVFLLVPGAEPLKRLLNKGTV